jgi:hypothetical protein
MLYVLCGVASPLLRHSMKGKASHPQNLTAAQYDTPYTTGPPLSFASPSPSLSPYPSTARLPNILMSLSFYAYFYSVSCICIIFFLPEQRQRGSSTPELPPATSSHSGLFRNSVFMLCSIACNHPPSFWLIFMYHCHKYLHSDKVACIKCLPGVNV